LVLRLTLGYITISLSSESLSSTLVHSLSNGKHKYILRHEDFRYRDKIELVKASYSHKPSTLIPLVGKIKEREMPGRQTRMRQDPIHTME